MRKMRQRARLCLGLALVLLLGLGIYVFQLATDGGTWVSYTGNGDLYTAGYLDKGAIYDRYGVLLRENNSGDSPTYNDDVSIRKATLHAVGDTVGNISTGAALAFADILVGYDFINGTYSLNNTGRNIYLTIDADANKAAMNALNGRNGCVAVYNYQTGEILCMYSSPSYDPLDGDSLDTETSSGAYINKFIESTVVPGSIFKVITATAALETIEDIDSWTFTCTGETSYGTADTDKVTCLTAHGTVTLTEALAKSCNCAFAELTITMGPEVLQEYVEKSGLTSSYSINGIATTPSSFEYPYADVTLAWTGIGQNNDLVNPCSIMVYLGAIANGGSSATPCLISDVQSADGKSLHMNLSTGMNELINSSTAALLDTMLRNNVTSNYGQSNFPGLEICAKSGTAEVGTGVTSHAWFVGYIRNEGYPYAFVVLVENGGSGATVAGSVANQVLQVLVSKDPQ